MIHDNSISSNEDTIIGCLESTCKKNAIDALHNAYLHLASFPEQAIDEDKYLLVLTAQLLKECKRKKLKTTVQVAHICEIAKYFTTIFDGTNYALFYSVAEPNKTIRTINKNPDTVVEMIISLFRSWNKVKNDTFVYRLMNELLTTIPAV